VNGNAYFFAPEDGSQFYDIGNDTDFSLYQTITVTDAGLYKLQWYASSTAYSADLVTPYSVTFDGTTTWFNPGYAPDDGGSWASNSLSFNLSPGDYTLTFTSGSHTGWDTALDNITLTSTPPVSAPEPATMLLLGLGLMGVLGIRRKIQK
jgi:hypothetical protein